MKKYRCIKACVGQPFNKRHWQEGMIAEVEDTVKMDLSLFEPIVQYVEVPIEKESYSTMQKKQKDAIKPKTGFAKGRDV